MPSGLHQFREARAMFQGMEQNEGYHKENAAIDLCLPLPDGYLLFSPVTTTVSIPWSHDTILLTPGMHSEVHALCPECICLICPVFCTDSHALYVYITHSLAMYSTCGHVHATDRKYLN